jgi:hypothetical protein
MILLGRKKGTESDFSRSSASKESKKNIKEKGGKEKGKGDEPIHDDNFKKGFKPDESSFLPEIKTGIDEYNFSLNFEPYKMVLISFFSHEKIQRYLERQRRVGQYKAAPLRGHDLC